MVSLGLIDLNPGMDMELLELTDFRYNLTIYFVKHCQYLSQLSVMDCDWGIN